MTGKVEVGTPVNFQRTWEFCSDKVFFFLLYTQKHKVKSSKGRGKKKSPVAYFYKCPLRTVFLFLSLQDETLQRMFTSYQPKTSSETKSLLTSVHPKPLNKMGNSIAHFYSWNATIVKQVFFQKKRAFKQKALHSKTKTSKNQEMSHA